MSRLDITILVLLLALGMSPEAFAENVLLKGKVIDVDGHGISGVKILLKDEEHNEQRSCRSDGNGNFELEHEQCSTMSFEVRPNSKSGFGTAHYSHVAGEMTKHFIVKLQKGYQISGRVLTEGQGVKGLEIRAIGQEDEKSSRSTVHGGGITHTNRNGEYSFLLTPGKKIIQIKNNLYSNLSPLYQHEITITGDSKLPDMTLPMLKEAQ